VARTLSICACVACIAIIRHGAHSNLRAKCFLSHSIVTRLTIEILRQDCSREQHADVFFCVSDGADFSSAFVNFSHRRVFGSRSMETHHRKVGYFIALRPAGIFGGTCFHKQKKRLMVAG
jgi:hypothetical protein